MMDINRLTNTIMRHEGSKKKNGRHIIYTDTTGHVTVGYGRNLTDRGLSEAEARYLLSTDIQTHLNELRSSLPWFDALDNTRQEVLVDLAFNLGVPGLLKFTRTLDYIKTGQYDLAAHALLDSKYASQVGVRARENAHALETGEFE